jgi:hypothetical protein
MRGSRNQFDILAVIGVVGIVLYFAGGRGEDEHRAKSHAQPIGDAESSETNPREFAGYECTEDCSGHEAGYHWAEEHDISDGDDCDEAGEHSNSPSFDEGCHAYVDGESDEADPEQEAADPDDEN